MKLPTFAVVTQIPCRILKVSLIGIEQDRLNFARLFSPELTSNDFLYVDTKIDKLAFRIWEEPDYHHGLFNSNYQHRASIILFFDVEPPLSQFLSHISTPYEVFALSYLKSTLTLTAQTDIHSPFSPVTTIKKSIAKPVVENLLKHLAELALIANHDIDQPFTAEDIVQEYKPQGCQIL